MWGNRHALGAHGCERHVEEYPALRHALEAAAAAVMTTPEIDAEREFHSLDGALEAALSSLSGTAEAAGRAVLEAAWDLTDEHCRKLQGMDPAFDALGTAVFSLPDRERGAGDPGLEELAPSAVPMQELERLEASPFTHHRSVLCVLVAPRVAMTLERAEYVRWLRVEQECSWRAVAQRTANQWLGGWGSNQLVGEELCIVAARLCGEDPQSEPWN